MTRLSRCVAAAVAASFSISTALAQDVITVGAAATTSDAPIYIADRLGYFREEGLTVKVTNFRSAADMVPVLGTGALDAGAGSAVRRPLQRDRAGHQHQDRRRQGLVAARLWRHQDPDPRRPHRERPLQDARRPQGLPLRDERAGREQHRDAQRAAEVGGSRAIPT